MEGRLPKIRKFLKRFRQLLKEARCLIRHMVVTESQQEEPVVTPSASPSAVASQRHERESKCGCFQLAERWNVDQVLLALVNGQRSAFSQRDSKRIVIS